MTINKHILRQSFYMITAGILASCAPLSAQPVSNKQSNGNSSKSITPLVIGAAAIGTLLYLSQKDHKKKVVKCPCRCGHNGQCDAYKRKIYHSSHNVYRKPAPAVIHYSSKRKTSNHSYHTNRYQPKPVAHCNGYRRSHKR